MTAPFRRAQQGERVKISAADWNAAMEAARSHQVRPGGAITGDPPTLADNLIWVRNDSGSDVPRFGVLGINGPIIGPTDNPQEFLRGVTIKGVTPTTTHQNEGTFVVLAGPIAAGRIGRGAISGIMIAKVQMVGSSDKTCGASSGNRNNLVSGSGRIAQILWVETGTGVKNAIIRFGAPGLAIAGFRFKSYGGTGRVVARSWDGLTEGTVDVEVWTPPLPPVMSLNDLLFAFQWNNQWRMLWTPPAASAGRYLQTDGGRTMTDHLYIEG